jgi:hypothetical protein
MLYEYQQFFQPCICFSIQPQLQLVNLHRNQRYFVIKLHTWFCLSYFLKTNIKFYTIYQYFMSINSFFNTVSVSRYSCPITVTQISTSQQFFLLIRLFNNAFLSCCTNCLFFIFVYCSYICAYYLPLFLYIIWCHLIQIWSTTGYT